MITAIRTRPQFWREGVELVRLSGRPIRTATGQPNLAIALAAVANISDTLNYICAA
jgi:hypothetical protein